VREVLCFLIIVSLIVLGWKRPYGDHFDELIGDGRRSEKAEQSANSFSETKPAAPGNGTPAVVRPPATPRDDSWRFKRTRLDPPERKGAHSRE
jgi:hypothetical protein